VAETDLSGLFRATIEAVKEAVLNSLLKAETMVGRDGVERPGTPMEELAAVLRAQGWRGQ
jgi:D-aminopeptidase